jgi:RNA polymerase sigma-70 factor, ECF subfamily
LAERDLEVEAALIALLPRLRRFARGLSATMEDADDLVQAACLRAIENLDKWERGTRLDSWMFAIVHRLRIDAARRAKTRRDKAHLVAIEQRAVGDLPRELEGRIILRRVDQEMAAMEPELRSLLMLVCVEGLSYREAAEVAGVPIGTVMSRLNRARTVLADRVGLDRADTGHKKMMKGSER